MESIIAEYASLLRQCQEPFMPGAFESSTLITQWITREARVGGIAVVCVLRKEGFCFILTTVQAVQSAQYEVTITDFGAFNAQGLPRQQLPAYTRLMTPAPDTLRAACEGEIWLHGARTHLKRELSERELELKATLKL